MKPTPVPSPTSLLLGALALAAIALAPAAAFASTAANTVITNTASVAYNDPGGIPQTPVTASATVTVILVPSAAAISSPGNQVVGQGTTVLLNYTITSTANGSDTYNLTSSITPTGMTAATNIILTPASLPLGGTTLAADAINGATSITVPYDGAAGTTVNGINATSVVVINGNAYSVSSVTKSPVANTTTIVLTTPIIGGTVLAGSIVGERKTFTETFVTGNVTAATNSGTQSVSTTGTSISGSNPAGSQVTPTAITVNRPALTVQKFVSTDNGASFGASGTAAPTTSLIYKIVATNTGTTTASQVAFTDVVPPYLTYVAGSGRFATSNATTYAAATLLTGVGDGYSYATASTTVTYNPGGATGTVAASNGVLVLFFRATIN
jgi:uncharacterized repeat protein (TIGR01451 family)